LLRALAAIRSFLAGTGLNLAGWALQVWALTRISLTFVQPVLGGGVFILLLAAWIRTSERPRAPDVAGAAALCAGVAVLARVAPPAGGQAAPAMSWIVAGALLAALALAPYALRSASGRSYPMLAAAAAGVAYSITGLTSEIVSRAIPEHRLPAAALAAATTAAFGLLGFLSEMSALVGAAVTAVVPVVLVIDTAVPVALAPFLFGERWPADATSRAALGLALFLAVGGAIVLASSPGAARIHALVSAPAAGGEEVREAPDL
jgi:drug/metabolite transporter (DMT)-like permease